MGTIYFNDSCMSDLVVIEMVLKWSAGANGGRRADSPVDLFELLVVVISGAEARRPAAKWRVKLIRRVIRFSRLSVRKNIKVNLVGG